LANQQQTYRTIMKTTSLLGGVQVFNIVIGIIRSKFLAVLLGPAGMGIAGLINATVGLVTTVTSFGLGTSAVKNVAEAHATQNENRISTVIGVFRKLVWLTGLLGTLVTFFTAPWLSNFAFGNYEYTTAFRWVSVTLLLGQLSVGQLAILQGMQQIKLLAKLNMATAVAGLIVSIPIYYCMGMRGIVPAILLSSVIGLSLSLWYAKKISIASVSVNLNNIKQEGKSMLQMGFLLSLSNLVGLGVAYLLSIYIGRIGGVAQVGLYNAGIGIVNGYIGLIFTAMATDYYPRLSAVATNNANAAKLINQQAEMAILIVAPIMAIFLVFINPILAILYSSKFFGISGMMQFFALGIFLKVVTWCMGYMILAKGDSKLFLFSELAANAYNLGLNLIFYKEFGLDGIGVAFITSFILALLQSYLILKIKYKFSFAGAFYKIYTVQFALVIFCFLLIKFLKGFYLYVSVVPVICLISAFSIIELNKRLDLVLFVKSKFNK
jgi:O-antigen/teichoic acid export membrane protein